MNAKGCFSFGLLAPVLLLLLYHDLGFLLSALAFGAILYQSWGAQSFWGCHRQQAPELFWLGCGLVFFFGILALIFGLADLYELLA